MITWAIVPVKPLLRAKSRLADILTPQERATLSLKMLTRNLKILKTCAPITNTLVISRDTQVLSLARNLGVHTVQESGHPELNDALARASQLLLSWGVEATLVLPADLPLLEAQEIAHIVGLGHYSGSVVIAPDDEADGTNALLLHPPNIIQYTYGEGSYQRHTDAAREAGAILHIYETERMKLDIDTPDDLVYYQMMAAKLGEDVIEFNGSYQENLDDSQHIHLIDQVS